MIAPADPEEDPLPGLVRPAHRVTGHALETWLVAHPLAPVRRTDAPIPEFLVADDEGLSFLVRWPTGAIQWTSRGLLETRGFLIPDEMLIR